MQYFIREHISSVCRGKLGKKFDCRYETGASEVLFRQILSYIG